MRDTEQHLRTAWSYIQSVEKEIPDFGTWAEARLRASNDDSATLAEAFRNGRAIARERHRLLQDLALAESEVRAAERLDPHAILAVDSDPERSMTIACLRMAASHDAGVILAGAGDLKAAAAKLREAASHVPTTETHYVLGVVLQELKQPREAVDALRRAAELEPELELAMEARKELGRLEARRLFGKYWFVGSWKIAGGLLVTTVLTILVRADPYPAALIPTVFFGGMTAIYLRWKLK
jgi:tetratricopeptide (TPR) repeat protein